MKIIKLNKRYKAFKEYGHTMALRFDSYQRAIAYYENACYAKLGSRHHPHPEWNAEFGSPNYKSRWSSRPYYISFRNPEDLTLILLSVGDIPSDRSVV